MALAAEDDAFRVFCRHWGLGMLLLWTIFSIGGGRDFHAAMPQKRSLVTRPTWLPARLVLWLARPSVYLTLCHAAPVALLIASVAPDSLLARLCVAVVVALYSLAESSSTHSHRDYPGTYICAASVVLPNDLLRGFALGVCIFFIGASGVGKLQVGGLTAWASPATLRGVLKKYVARSLDDPAGGIPLLPGLTSWLCNGETVGNGLLCLLASGTLLFEVVLVPASLVMPPWYAQAMIGMSVTMHLGITVLQSALIGVAFLPNLASYALGFGSGVAQHSRAWLCALVVVAVPTAYLAARGGRRPLPENWRVTHTTPFYRTLHPALHPIRPPPPLARAAGPSPTSASSRGTRSSGACSSRALPTGARAL